MQQSMYFRHISAIWIPTKVSVILLILIGLLQTSAGYVGTSDSTIFYFGNNTYGQNGNDPVTDIDLIMDVDVSILRSISCGSSTTVFLFDNNTMTSIGQAAIQESYGASYPQISSVSSISDAIMYSLTSNASIYGCGKNMDMLLWNSSRTIRQGPKLSPPRLNEDIRLCAYPICLAFDNFPPGSITNEQVIHEPSTPLYKFIGGWGDLSNGHLGIVTPPLEPTSGMYYEGPDLIVKKVRMSESLSIFILHNNTVLVAGRGSVTAPTDGSPYEYLPIVYNTTVANPSSVKIVDASASLFHALLLSEDHRVFFFGYNYYCTSGIPGVPKGATVNRVTEVPFDGILYPDDYIIQIRAQRSRSSVITKMGYVYIWGTQSTLSTRVNGVQYTPTLENTLLQDRYAVGYLNQDDITKTTHNADGSCIITRPRAGNCTGMPPSAEYYCIGGLWTTRGGSNLETLTISSPTEIDGNLTISGSLVINQQSNISVTQCLSVGSIEIVKQQGDDSPSQDVISTDKDCPDISGASISVISTENDKKCGKETATLLKSEMGGRIIYSAIFKTNDNDCIHHHSNLWWIILVSVLGGVALIVIIVILLVTFVKPIRVKVRPFWRRQHS